MSTAKAQTVYDVWKPPDQRPLRQLPRLVGSSFALLWESARSEFALLALVHVLSGALNGVMLVLIKNLLASDARDARDDESAQLD